MSSLSLENKKKIIRDAMEWITPPIMDGHGPTNDQHCLVGRFSQSKSLVKSIGTFHWIICPKLGVFEKLSIW